MISVTSRSRRLTAFGRRSLCLWLGLALLLSACGTSTVPRGGLRKQVPSGIITREGVIYRIPGDPGYLPDTALTRVELDGAIKIGLLLPLSGRHARLGEALLNAAQLALFDVADQRFTLVVRDTRGTPQGAAVAARAVLAEGSRLILGPLFASSVKAMAEVAREFGVKVIAFSNDRTVAGNGTFLIGLLPHEQISRVVAHARDKGIERFAALVPETPFGRRMAADLGDAVARLGGVLTQVESYRRDRGDITRARNRHYLPATQRASRRRQSTRLEWLAGRPAGPLDAVVGR